MAEIKVYTSGALAEGYPATPEKVLSEIKSLRASAEEIVSPNTNTLTLKDFLKKGDCTTFHSGLSSKEVSNTKEINNTNILIRNRGNSL